MPEPQAKALGVRFDREKILRIQKKLSPTRYARPGSKSIVIKHVPRTGHFWRTCEKIWARLTLSQGRTRAEHSLQEAIPREIENESASKIARILRCLETETPLSCSGAGCEIRPKKAVPPHVSLPALCPCLQAPLRLPSLPPSTFRGTCRVQHLSELCFTFEVSRLNLTPTFVLPALRAYLQAPIRLPPLPPASFRGIHLLMKDVTV